MRARAVVGATALAVASAAGFMVVSPANAGGPGTGALDATLSPDPVAPGGEVTVTPVDPCPIAAPVAAPAGLVVGTLEWIVTTPDPDDESDVVDDGDAPITSDGLWEVVFNAPAEPGDYEFYGFCNTDIEVDEQGVRPAGEVANPEQYGPIPFTVAGVEELAFEASLDKASGPPGDDIELTAIQCDGDSGAAALLPVGPPPASPSDVDEDVLQQYDVLQGQFGGVVPVPDDTAPGTYQVVVWCMGQGEVLDSEVLGYTVLAPGAAPVPAAPDFTG